MDDLLKIVTFGGLTITRGGTILERFVSRKVDALLVYLACNPREHPRELLGQILWEDMSQERAMGNLRTALSNLQAQLASYFLITRQTASINPESSYWIDAHELDTVLDTAEQYWKHHGNFTRSLITATEKGLALFQGNFLEGFHLRDARGFEGWMLLEQERQRGRVIEMYKRLADHALQREWYDEGIVYAKRVIEFDPLWEEAYRLLMLLLVRTGQRGTALAQYEVLRRILADELDIVPEVETDELYAQIEAGEIELAVPAPATPHNLPNPATPFVPRNSDLDAIRQRLEDPICRLLTLTGVGGIGKTRIAIEAARQELANFHQGVYFVPLASIDSPDFLVQTIACTLNLTFEETKQPEQELIKYLHNRELLLVLDNFEHLLDGADLVSHILANAPDVKILTTSRERLNLQEEWLYSVDGMSFQNGENELWDGAQLFIQSARRVQSAFSPADHLPAIRRICELVDGLPLAIELAASWLGVMTCEQIAAHIENDLDLLSTSLRNIPERHRSIRLLIEQSIQSLTPAEIDAMLKLAIFRDRFDFNAARIIVGTGLPMLARLVEKSLLRAETNGRYIMHEILRRYAYKALKARGDLDSVQRAHCHYYTLLAEQAGTQDDYVSVSQEYNHMRAALIWASDMQAAPEFVRLINALGFYWRNYGYFNAARSWIKRALALNLDSVPKEQHAKLLTYAGHFAWSQSDFDEARALLDEALMLYRQTNDVLGKSQALRYLGYLNLNTGRFDDARACFEEVLAIGEVTHDESVIAAALGNLGQIAMELQDYEGGKDYIAKALAIARRKEALETVTILLCNLGNIDLAQGNYAQAQRHYEESLEVGQRAGNRVTITFVLINMGEVLHNLGDHVAALTRYREGLCELINLGDKLSLTATVESAAYVLIDLDQPARAVRLLGACDAMRERLRAPIAPREQARVDKFINQARTQMGDSEFTRSWNEGRKLTFEQALDDVLETT